MVAFEDRFWGDKNAGYDVLYHNMKYGYNASVKVSEFIRERSTVEETFSKSLLKIAKSACSVTQLGTFEPLWVVMRVATDKLANAHHSVVGKLQELGKEVKEYSDKQKEKHKTAKEEFSSTAEIVQTMQIITASLTKAKETYYARCHEHEKLKKEATSPKEIEKAEAKMRKAGEEYKSLVEKREIIRNEFHDKMEETARKFQEIEEEHLKTIVGHLEVYIDSHMSGLDEMQKVHTEFREHLRALSIDKLLDQLVRSKGTGSDIPDVITFEEYEGQTDIGISAENSPSATTKSQTIKPGFSLPKKKERKEKKEKKTKKKKDKEKDKGNHSQSSQDSPEHQHNGQVESPGSEEMPSQDQSYEVDEEGYRIRPQDSESARSFGGSSGSDFDSDGDDEPRKFQVTIKPVDNQVTQTASVDEIKKITETLSLSSPSSMRRNLSSSSGLSDGFRTRAATENYKTSNTNKLKSRSSDDLLDINFSQASKKITSPGSGSSLSPASADTSKTDPGNNISAFDSFTKPHPLAVSSPGTSFFSLEQSAEDKSNDDDVPPVLPRKKSSLNNIVDDQNVPPPLPAKGREGFASIPGNNNNTEVPALPLLNKPPSRGLTTNAALARPRPLGTQQKKTSLTLHTGQISDMDSTNMASSGGMSYSEELFSFMSDLDFTNASSNQSSTNDSEDAGPKTPKTPSKVSYMGSVSAVENTLSKAITTSSLQDGLDNDQDRGLIRSKTVGAMPSVPPRAKDEVLPIAVAFIESVNAFFRGNDYKSCMVKVTGDITVSFPASIVTQLTSAKELPTLNFFVTGTSSLEQLIPNKALITSEGQQSGGDAVSYKFNMTALSEHLKKQIEGSTSSYYNIDILKYEVRSSGIQSTPLQLCSYWRCEPTLTNVRVDYRYNPTCMSTPCALNNLSVVVPVNGGVTIMQSKPSAKWSAENQRAVWHIPEVSNPKEPDGSLRAKLDLTNGPSTPSRIAVQFSSTGATLSKLNFELKSDAYKLSLVKKQITTGRYIAES